MPVSFRFSTRPLLAGPIMIALASCADFDIRDNFGNALDTSGAVEGDLAPRPQADERGVISYSSYRFAVARADDTITDVANRIGVDPELLAKYNALTTDTPLRPGEIIAIPGTGEASSEAGVIASQPIDSSEEIDVEAIASEAIDRAEPDRPVPDSSPAGIEPIRHRVERGETAYSISRLYNVSVNALAEWNSLGADFTVREGQYLMIPYALEEKSEPPQEDTAPPGSGTPAPAPPSASTPLPEEGEETVAPPETIPSPELPQRQSSATQSELLFPVNGNIVRPYEKGSNAGIDITASVGADVLAADDGVVAAITQDTEEVPVLIVRHADNLLTVYANVADIAVEKGEAVSRGQKIAEVRSGNPSFIRFEVRRGFDAIDPMPLLNPSGTEDSG